MRQKKFCLSSQIELSPLQSIKPSVTGCLLRVILDSKLKWKNHVEIPRAKAMKSLYAIARLIGSTWGGNFTTLRQLYRRVVIPHLSYMCLLWYTPVGKKGHCKSHLQMLETVQSRAVRIITRAFKATPLSALDIEAHLLPLHLQLEKLVEEAVLRLAISPSSKLLFQVLSKNKKQKIGPLEVLARKFEKQWDIELSYVGLILPYATPPWWLPPKSASKQTKNRLKKEWTKDYCSYNLANWLTTRMGVPSTKNLEPP